jgi:arsenate reductase
MNPKIKAFLDLLAFDELNTERKSVLKELIQYIQLKKNAGKVINLNFICTHNSRRSQFSQVWAQVVASFYDIDINSYSGGVEVTACNERTIDSLKRSGFEVFSKGDVNPHHHVKWGHTKNELTLFSKLFDDCSNPNENFAAVMTCSHADENCPYVTGCDARIPIRYEDPKSFDDTDEETKMYDVRSKQIATEMKFVFSQIK